jgi:hypothetical protein
MGKLTYNPEMILQAEFFLFSRGLRLLPRLHSGSAAKTPLKGWFGRLTNLHDRRLEHNTGYATFTAILKDNFIV